MCPCFIRGCKSLPARVTGPCVSAECGGLVEADPRPGEPRAKHRRSRASRMGGAWRMGGGSRVRSPTAPQPRSSSSPTSSMVKSKCLHCSRSPHAASRPPSAPEARPLAQGHHPRGLATRMPREIATSPHGPKPRSSTPVLLRSRVPAKGSPICRLWPPGLQPAWPGLDASVQARLDARWHRRLRLP